VHSFPPDPSRIPGLPSELRSPLFARETAFALRVPAGAEARLDPEEHDAHQWVSPAEALRLLTFAGLRRAVRLTFGESPPEGVWVGG